MKTAAGTPSRSARATFDPLDESAAVCLERCNELAGYTEVAGEITRRFLTPPMFEVHRAVKGWMEGAGMSVRVDAAGNIIGHRPATLNKPGERSLTLLLGSHLDTVPNAGRYDGILGVVAAIAVIEQLRTVNLPFSIDVMGFSDEEGVRFGQPYLGSSAVSGTFDPGWLDCVDNEGCCVREAMLTYGLNPNELDQAIYSQASVLGYLEIHIEQGRVLAAADQPVAAVTAIAGQSRLRVRMIGQCGHAGTTVMHGRRDALVAAARWIVAVHELAQQTDDLRATVGYVDVQPGARNVIPGRVDLSLDVRHSNNTVRETCVEMLLHRGHRIAQSADVLFEVCDHQTQRAVAMTPFLTTQLINSMTQNGIGPYQMVSGAGHDAIAMAPVFPCGLLFIRQPIGLSHHPDEDVKADDVTVALRVLSTAILNLASEVTQSP